MSQLVVLPLLRLHYQIAKNCIKFNFVSCGFRNKIRIFDYENLSLLTINSLGKRICICYKC